MNHEKTLQQLRSQAVKEFLSLNHPHFLGSEALVYIPVFNEEHTIAKVVEGVRRFCNFDVIVVEDGSTDATLSILQHLGVEVLSHPTPMSSWNILSALEVGHALGYKYIIKIDGDDQQDPRDIPRLYSHAIQTGADTVIGSRHLERFSAKIWSVEGSGMWFCSKLLYLLSGRRITDTTSGFKLWNRRSAQVIIQAFNEGKLKDVTTFLVEELLITTKRNLRIEEINVAMYPRQYGESKCYASKKKLAMFPFNLVRSTFRAFL
ncbi:MAG: hypothetical protein A2144_00310 [Chloroflexi bacterium RBG_16_50_9]|nr:MAG: hypothetical protein A2144_00310 [Chloroflexi bacterium RBG_16_50_9]